MPLDAPFPYTGPEALRQPVIDALMRVVDPEVALSIVDVGLVYGVAVTAERLHVLLTMTSAACPVADVIIEDIETELGAIASLGQRIDVELTWTPAWSPERISERSRRFMGW
jgi:metal-sulfur cluster biosynthetic enzyme